MFIFCNQDLGWLPYGDTHLRTAKKATESLLNRHLAEIYYDSFVAIIAVVICNNELNHLGYCILLWGLLMVVIFGAVSSVACWATQRTSSTWNRLSPNLCPECVPLALRCD